MIVVAALVIVALVALVVVAVAVGVVVVVVAVVVAAVAAVAVIGDSGVKARKSSPNWEQGTSRCVCDHGECTCVQLMCAS